MAKRKEADKVIVTLNQHLEKFKSIAEQQKTEIIDLRKEIGEKDDAIKSLEKQSKTKDIEIVELQTRVSTVEEFSKKMEVLLSDRFDKKIQLLENENASLKQEIEKLKAKNESKSVATNLDTKPKKNFKNLMAEAYEKSEKSQANEDKTNLDDYKIDDNSNDDDDAKKDISKNLNLLDNNLKIDDDDFFAQ